MSVPLVTSNDVLGSVLELAAAKGRKLIVSSAPNVLSRRSKFPLQQPTDSEYWGPGGNSRKTAGATRREVGVHQISVLPIRTEEGGGRKMLVRS